MIWCTFGVDSLKRIGRKIISHAVFVAVVVQLVGIRKTKHGSHLPTALKINVFCTVYIYLTNESRQYIARQMAPLELL